jgi:riboflavin kinase/FMN adenylyltransferase
MLVLDWNEFVRRPAGDASAMTIGVFDGVHRGHRALIGAIVERGPFPTVITFRQNPLSILTPRAYKGDIFSLEQKLACLETLGVERTILIDFSGNFSKLKGQEFIDLLIKQGSVDFLAVGGNFRGGYKLDTDTARIQALGERAGTAVEVIPPLREGRGPVSSSRIRSAILKGRMAEASRFLGRNVVLDLRGIQSEKRGDALLYRPALRNRICARQGSFSVVLYQKDSREGKEMDIHINGEGIVIPVDNCEYIEFVPDGAVTKN